MQSFSGVVIERSVPIVKTPRLMQLEGIFDLPPSQRSTERWTVDLNLPPDWNVGLIVGPSGSGKTTIAKHLWEECMIGDWDWPQDKSILDAFPPNMGIKQIVELLSSVGFSSPPSWVRPYRVLSTGEQFRVNLARTLAEQNNKLAVVDEFTSVVDRTVAQIGSAALQKTVRERQQRLIALSCHYDIIDWLEPDWVYQPHTNELYTGRWLHQRPKIELRVERVHKGAWQMFRKHHYLDTSLNNSAVCFCAFWNNTPVAFTAVIHFPHPQDSRMKREHRTVCLPDYQGVGIGNAMSDYIGSVVKGLGFRYRSITSHPAMIRSRKHNKNWRMTDVLDRTFPVGLDRRTTSFIDRLRSSFEYVGSALPFEQAQQVWNG